MPKYHTRICTTVGTLRWYSTYSATTARTRRDGIRLMPVSTIASRNPPASAPAKSRRVTVIPVVSMPTTSGSDSMENEKSIRKWRGRHAPSCSGCLLLRRVSLGGRRHRFHLEVARHLVDRLLSHPLVIDPGQLARLVQRR